MSGSQLQPNQPGRYQLAQTTDGRTQMLVDTLTGRSWFRITAGTDHYAWRPMRFEPTSAESPPA